MIKMKNIEKKPITKISTIIIIIHQNINKNRVNYKNTNIEYVHDKIKDKNHLHLTNQILIVPIF